MALEALGGTCVFASEINPECVETYRRNFAGSGSSHCDAVAGDICAVAADTVPDHDILVGGFPCQPFSALGLQPGLADESKGWLFLDIVRILKAKQPRAFLLENVPGLLTCDEGRAFEAIRVALTLEGRYSLTVDCVNAKCVTAMQRNRLFFVGLRNDVELRPPPPAEPAVATTLLPSSSPFRFPYIPDLRLCFGDIQERDIIGPLVQEYTVSNEVFGKVLASRSWGTKGPNGRLAWHSKSCEPLISHYGTCVGNGASMLVPQEWPFNPRLYTVKECARLMGFPDAVYDPGPVGLSASQLLNPHGGQYSATRVWFKTHFRMLGNAVCPPVIAVISGALLDRLFPVHAGEVSLTDAGLLTAIRLTYGAVDPSARLRVIERWKATFS